MSLPKLFCFIVGLWWVFSGIFVVRSHEPRVHAANPISSCYAILTPSSMNTESTNTVSITIDNGESESAIEYVQIEIPALVTLQSGSSSGWNAASSGNTITFTGNTIPAGSSKSFSLSLASTTQADRDSMIVRVAPSSDGSDDSECQGSVSLTVSASPTLSISNVTISNISNTSVTITHSTNISATTSIRYGTSTSYGSTVQQSTSTTNHSVVLTGLNTNTTYHYQITASADTSTSTDDATFTTALSASATSTPGPTSTPIIQTTTTTITAPTPTPIPDTQKPTITIQALSSSRYRSMPSISGTAGDNTNISLIQYSINEKMSWQTVRGATGIGTTYAIFRVTPTIEIDQNQSKSIKIYIRAQDSSGNSTETDLPLFTIDRTSPALSITTQLNRSYQVAPLIEGKVVDSSEIIRIEYSLDASSWTMVDTITTRSDTTVFSFTPPLRDDGNYLVYIRATDQFENTSAPMQASLVIDRIPPKRGPVVVAIGPQLFPDPTAITTVTNLEQIVSLSIIGGAITSELRLYDASGNRMHTYPLQPSSHHLWSTNMHIETAGTYLARIYAIDGAGREIESELGTVNVYESGTIRTPNPQNEVFTITLYVKDVITDSFIPWDGVAYGQQNPQQIHAEEGYAFYPQNGTYYIEVKRKGSFVRHRTEIFQVDTNHIISPTLLLNSTFKWNPLSQTIQTSWSQSSDAMDALQSEPSPLSTELRSLLPIAKEDATKPVRIVFLNTWHPQTSTYILQLEAEKERNPNIPIVIISPHESIASTEIFMRRGGYAIPFVGDPDGVLFEAFGSIQPQNGFIVETNGVIRVWKN